MQRFINQAKFILNFRSTKINTPSLVAIVIEYCWPKEVHCVFLQTCLRSLVALSSNRFVNDDDEDEKDFESQVLFYAYRIITYLGRNTLNVMIKEFLTFSTLLQQLTGLHLVFRLSKSTTTTKRKETALGKIAVGSTCVVARAVFEVFERTNFLPRALITSEHEINNALDQFWVTYTRASFTQRKDDLIATRAKEETATPYASYFALKGPLADPKFKRLTRIQKDLVGKKTTPLTKINNLRIFAYECCVEMKEKENEENKEEEEEDERNRNGRLNEIKIMQYIPQHPNLISLIGVIGTPPYTEDTGPLYAIMDKWLPWNLHFVLNESERLRTTFSLQVIQVLMQDLLNAVYHLHNVAQVVHGDLKPANILVELQGKASAVTDLLSQKGFCRLLLTDFGLCREIGTSTDALYTVYWRAPEILISQLVANDSKLSFQFRHFTSVMSMRPSMDMYALGVILAQLLGPERIAYDPFGSSDLEELSILEHWFKHFGHAIPSRCRRRNEMIKQLIKDKKAVVVPAAAATTLLQPAAGDDKCLLDKAYDLMINLLTWPELRFSAQEALHHPFIINKQKQKKSKRKR